MFEEMEKILGVQRHRKCSPAFTEHLLGTRYCPSALEILTHSIFFKTFFVYFFILWLHWAFTVTHRLSLVAASGGSYSLSSVHGLLTAVLPSTQSTDSEHRLSGCGSRA